MTGVSKAISGDIRSQGIYSFSKPPFEDSTVEERVLPLPPELRQRLVKYLKIQDLGRFEQLNRNGQAHAYSEFVRYAETLGYKVASEDKRYQDINTAGAKEYLKNLTEEVKTVWEKGVIDKEYWAFKQPPEQDRIDCEGTLCHLKRLPGEKACEILMKIEQASDGEPFYTTLKRFLVKFASTAKMARLSQEAFKQVQRFFISVVERGEKEIVKFLLERKIIDSECVQGALRSPLNADSAIIDLLMRHRAKDASLVEDNAVLYDIACGGHYATVKIFLESGCDPNGGYQEGELIRLIVLKGDSRIVKLLLKWGACNIPDGLNRTALSYAVENGHDGVMEVLLPYSLQYLDLPSFVDHGSAVMFAAVNGFANCVELLLHKGADPDLPDRLGNTPLMWAVRKKFSKVVEALLQGGADSTIVDREDYTPLMLAAAQGDIEIVRLFLHYGADPNLANKDRITPLLLATARNHHQIVEILLLQGANPNCRDKFFYTPLLLAKNHDIAILLQRHGAVAQTFVEKVALIMERFLSKFHWS